MSSAVTPPPLVAVIAPFESRAPAVIPVVAASVMLLGGADVARLDAAAGGDRERAGEVDHVVEHEIAADIDCEIAVDGDVAGRVRRGDPVAEQQAAARGERRRAIDDQNSPPFVT